MSQYYIGLMSGTSLDQVDAALIEVDSNLPRFLRGSNQPIPEALRKDILSLNQGCTEELDLAGCVHRLTGQLFADAVLALLDEAEMSADQIRAIGSHGQTVRHRPPDWASGKPAFTMQLGDPSTIAAITGITTVADFRAKDIALGGHAAPLAPALHQALFQQAGRCRAVVNIGGMANITLLPASGPTLGFDTGPGNVLMDDWIQRCQNKPYDEGGAWAASGSCHSEMLAALLAHPFLEVAAGPRSTGREAFGPHTIDQVLGNFSQLPSEDIQATLLEFTAQTLLQSLQAYAETPAELIVCGGGTRNHRLMTRLQELQPNSRVICSDELGMPADWLEACAFGWFAANTLAGLHSNIPEVTGASRAAVLGGIYPP